MFSSLQIDTKSWDLPMLQSRARRVRARVVRMACAGKTPHVGSALSCVDLLVALYFSTLQIDPANPNDEGRDRLILSKGHGCMAQYAVLVERGFRCKGAEQATEVGCCVWLLAGGQEGFAEGFHWLAFVE